MLTLDRSLSRLKRFRQSNSAPQSDRDNRIALAFWTCFELERYVRVDICLSVTDRHSDISTELPMPQSGILKFDEMIPFPDISLQVITGYDSTIAASYQAQLWARKQLNQVYSQLYDSGEPGCGSVTRSSPELLQWIGKP